MKKKILATALLALVLFGCKNADQKKDSPLAENFRVAKQIVDSTIHYNIANKPFVGFAAYDKAANSKHPIVLIVPEWWGVSDYVKKRAKQLAELGYVAMVVDMYGDGKLVETPAEAQALSAPFYKNPKLGQERFEAAMAVVKRLPYADTAMIAAIGYCFGGAQVLNMAKLGESLKGVVSFHGNLNVVTPQKGLTKANVLVCNGVADKFVSQEEIATFKKQMDSVGAAYTFKNYPDALHAFTNPAATAIGKKYNIPIAYNAAADTTSWNDMKAFFSKVF